MVNNYVATVMPSENVAKLELHPTVNLHVKSWYSGLSYNCYILATKHMIIIMKSLVLKKAAVLLYYCTSPASQLDAFLWE